MDELLKLKPLYTQASGKDEGDNTSLLGRYVFPATSGKDEGDNTSLLGQYVFPATIVFTIAVFLLEFYLDLRQRRAYKVTKFPTELAKTVGSIDADTGKAGSSAAPTGDRSKGKNKGGEIDAHKPLLPQLQTKFTKAQAYGMDKVNFSLVSQIYGTFEAVAFLLLGFFPYCWDKSASWSESTFGWTETDHEIKVTLIFLGLTTIIGTITGLPFEIYSTFQIERKHGFNKQTAGLFITDKLKSLVLTTVIGGPFIALLLKIIKWGGEHFHLYVWAFTFVFSVFMMTIVPVVIMPMFNKYEPLKDGPLKTQIYELADKLKYPLTKLFVMDGSKRSSHSNAFMFGFGKNKRIVLFDTLLEQVHDDEILAILGHELGHWKLGHTLSNFAITQIYTGAAFYCFSLCYTSHDLYRAFGFDGEERPVPTIIALLLFFMTLWAPVDKVLSFLLTIFSRINEFGADRFSHGLGMSKKLQSGLVKISLENLGAMCPDPLYSTYHYSHPPLVERLNAMIELDKKEK